MKRKKNELSGFFNINHNSNKNGKNRGQNKSKAIQDDEDLDTDRNNVVPEDSPQFSFGFSFV